ncbi:MAG: iron-containing alcohol dehydrogenase [Firmicutes bacterium]|nr:iron-containing alcohol dehydrogenase [Bacillota bacterium]
MNNFTYSVPTTVHFGKGQISQLADSVKMYGSRVLLVYGGGSIKKNGVYDAATALLKENDIFYVDLDGVEPNPRVETVARGVDLCREHNIDIVVALGGGSSIDCAKAVCASVNYEGHPWDLVLDNSKVPAGVLPLIAVLTLSATGSEMDATAVISNMTTNRKLALINPELRPKVAIMDPEYTYSVPKYQTASGTADIFSHTLESFFSPVRSAYLQNQFCIAILKTCMKYGPVALEAPNNYEARANLMWASSWAINDTLKKGNETGWSVHPLEHELSAYYDITHGVGLAILTPHWMRAVLNEDTVDRFVTLATEVYGFDASEPAMELAEKAIDATAKFFFETLGLPSTLKEVGIDETYLADMAENCKARLAMGFVALTPEQNLEIYKAAL